MSSGSFTELFSSQSLNRFHCDFDSTALQLQVFRFLVCFLILSPSNVGGNGNVNTSINKLR